jgi:hypothetical protein
MTEMHESNEMFQAFVGKTVARVDYVDDYDEGITVIFTDGSILNVSERMQAGQIEVCAVVTEQGDDWAERMADEHDKVKQLNDGE